MAKIKIDCSESSVVLVCKSCGDTWRAFAWDRSEAYDRAVLHEQRTHPGTDEMQQARSLWRRRNAIRALATASVLVTTRR